MSYKLYSRKKDAVAKEYLESSIKMVLEGLKSNEKDYEVYKIVNFGRMLEGEAYYHEVNEYYRCVGFEIEIESQFAFGEGKNKKLLDLERKSGFYSIWVGKSNEAAPFTFEEGYQELGKSHNFSNAFGDRIKVVKEIYSLEEVQKIAKNFI